MKPQTIYTIGHSTRSMKEFLDILDFFEVKFLVDIRRLPSSRKFPQFNKDNLKIALEQLNIGYLHSVDLGGRRMANIDSKNNRWKNLSFKGYADYMETKAFKIAIENLQNIALKHTTVYMCAEAVWWRCHRSMVSDYLKA